MTKLDYEEINTNIERECASLWISQQDANDIIETLKDAWFLNREWEKFYKRHREKHRKGSNKKPTSMMNFEEILDMSWWSFPENVKNQLYKERCNRKDRVSRHVIRSWEEENLVKCDSCWEYSEMVASLEWPDVCELCRD